MRWLFSHIYCSYKVPSVTNQKDMDMIDTTFMGKIKWLTAPLTKILIRESGLIDHNRLSNYIALQEGPLAQDVAHVWLYYVFFV